MGVGVKHEGEYKLLTGNQSGSVLIEYILSQLSEKGQMRRIRSCSIRSSPAISVKRSPTNTA